MSNKTKTIIEESTDSIDPKGLAVLSYRVGQLETASKDAATAQREGVEMLSGKIDKFAHNFITQATLDAAQRESLLQHAILRDDINNVRSIVNSHSKTFNWLARTVIGIIILAVIGLLIVTKITGHAG